MENFNDFLVDRLMSEMSTAMKTATNLVGEERHKQLSKANNILQILTLFEEVNHSVDSLLSEIKVKCQA